MFNRGKKNFTKEYESYNKILSINEYESCFLFKTIDLTSRDTVFIISIKKQYYEDLFFKKPFDEDLRLMNLNDKVKFITRNALFRGNTLGLPVKSVIIKNDTIWQGNMNINPDIYISMNSIGLYVKNNEE